MTRTVQDLLRRKGTAIVTTSPDDTVYDCIQTMVDRNVGSILVVDGTELVGIFTERDYLRRIVLQGRTSKTTTLRDVMTTDVLVATPDMTIEECLARMTTARCRHLPVLTNGELRGIVSIGDCVKRLLQDAQGQVDSLQNYVTGRYPV
jgi:CBS domain-containing protein